MRVPLSWLRRHVPVSLSPDELAHHLTMAGTEVSSVSSIGAQWDREKILIGQVIKVDEHPNADRLTLPTIDLGNGESATVVCGATNVTPGAKVAFAREGAELFSLHADNLTTLKATKIRGVVSAGMVCSDLELGLGDNHDGIIILEDSAPIGMPLIDYLGDAILDIEATPNRPDCLSVLGIAHEAAALTGTKVNVADLSYPEEGGPIEDQVKVKIANPDLCRRYTAALIVGINVGPSPQWIQDALIKAGQRPINNVVDITNYAMLEYGQPLHAFDFSALKGETIIVRMAYPDEELVTLDGEKRILNPPILTIANPHESMGLAGVMGGANSELHEGTTSVLLESANFDPVNTRRTSTGLRLTTEASYRFERGVRAELAPIALRRATQLILQIAGGRAARGIIDLYPNPEDPPVVRISSQRIKQVLGTDFDMAEVKRVLISLGFAPSKPQEGAKATEDERAESTLWMKVPYWRSDISIEDDLVEEVARIVGYDTIPTTMLSSPIPQHTAQPLLDLKENLKDLLAISGMQEIITYPLTSQKTLSRAAFTDTASTTLKLSNPMSRELEYLRISLIDGILQSLGTNRRVAHGEGIRLFEIGRVYLPREDSKDIDLPHEREMLAGVLSGPRFSTSWVASQCDMNFFDAKGELEWIFEQLGLLVEYHPTHIPLLHPGRSARLTSGDIDIGLVGELDSEGLERLNLGDASVALFEINLESLLAVMSQTEERYRSPNKYPEAHRDLALLVRAEIPSSRIQKIIEGHNLVVKAIPFDIYQGENIPNNMKSIAYKVIFQSQSGTLKAEQVDGAQEHILGQLKREVGVALRTQWTGEQT